MQTTYWINKITNRYYIASLYQDLLGDYIVATANGGISNKLGSFRTHVCKNSKTQLKKFNDISKKRLQRKYTRVL